ncbi:carbonic anhydrase [Halogeometricum pallidum JCM 14848]|uniref:carbonic anhydrase n=1 Tax=Halogeometricum pallidum JCM 14848 TaxID=1227487 RepID=M0DHR1_HALPD|nr:carbonic anhydrase [Halogeometricum pallidum]ELZ35011.1 carbonic anhydrase [Halogeometricum pallidum JCM 14848]
MSDDTEISRRKALKAGGAGATMLGILGYGARGVAAADADSRSDREDSEPGSDRDEFAFGGDLPGLLERNGLWSDALPEGYFEGVRTSQSPAVVSICCSDSRVSQAGMFAAPLDAGFLFKPSNIGNKVTTRVDGERAVDGSFLYGLEVSGASSGVVVGHTGCGAVTAAYESVVGETEAQPPGIEQEVAPIVDVVEEALDGGAVETDAERRAVINQLVEYNVHAQVEYLRGSDEVSEEKDLYGFVYDFQSAYGDVDGRTVLVNADGETDPDALRETVPDGYEEFVGSLLH